MKMLSPNEYKIQYPNATLDDYVSYLETAQKKAEEALESAKNIPLDSAYVNNIKAKAEEIFQMAMLVEEYMGQIILKSIDTLSKEELQSYFDFDAENSEAEEKKKNLNDEKQSIKNRLEEVEKQIGNNLYMNGRVRDFYEKEGVENFFTKNKKPFVYIGNILSTPDKDSAFDRLINDLEKLLKVVLETECSIQGIELSQEERERIVKEIIELLKTYKNIANHSPEAKMQLSKLVLSDSGIKKILPEAFDENTCFYLIEDLMNLKKISTPFYLNLPVPLQKKLANERLQGETYKTLFKSYQAVLSGEELPSDDLNQEEKDEKKELEGKIGKIDYDLASLETDRESQERFLEDEEAMRSVLRETILKSIKGQVTARDIDSIITAAESKNEKLRKELQDASNKLSTKTVDLEEAKKILLDPEYHDFFEAVELNNAHRLYNFFGVNVTEEVVTPFINEEKRRYEQIKLMTDLQNKLSSIAKEIKTKKEKANFIKRRLPQYKESLRQLEEKYHAAIDETFNKLKEQNLFHVNAPRISDESTKGNVIVLPLDKYQQEPKDFSEVSGLEQILWNMSTGFDENTKQKFLALNPKYNTWEEYYQDLTKTHSELVKKLFSFQKRPDEYYDFDSTEEDREKLKQLQSTIIDILNSLYDERKALREKFGESYIDLDCDKTERLKQLLGSGVNFSRENLANYIDQTKSEIEELKILLSNNYTLCSELGISLPEDITAVNDNTEKEKHELEEKIRGLNIEGVTTLEEAIAYRDILLGLEEYPAPPAKVKQYYLEHK